MDEEAALLPKTAITTADHTQVLADPAAAATALGESWVEGLLSWARWAVLFIILFIRLLEVIHKNIFLLLLVGMGMGWGKVTGTGTGTGTGRRLK